MIADVPPFATSNNQKIYAEPLTETSHGGLAEINDVNSMEVGNSPVRDELPAHNSAENSLPGGDTNASKTVLDNMLMLFYCSIFLKVMGSFTA